MRHSCRLRGRLTKLVLVGGFVVLLALAIGLVQLTHEVTHAADPTPAVVVAPTPPPPPAPAAVVEPVHPARPIAAREPTPAPRGHMAQPDRQPSLSAPMFAFKTELKRDANGKPQPVIPLTALRDLLPTLDAPMKACLERAGQRPTGKAQLSFTVAAKDGKLFVESTGVQDDETLGAYPELLECMHRTASALAFGDRPVPDVGTPIYVRRNVRLDNGELVENTLPSFSYSP
jgi:hypothetical protein